MYLNYSKLRGERIETPQLRLRTLAGQELGVIPMAYGVRFTINYADVSEIEFSVPYMSDGKVNPLYDKITGYKVVYTEDFGIYVLDRPSTSGDGKQEVKTAHGYSIERLFKNKRLYLDEGTYAFWSVGDTKDTILGRIVELDENWSVGYVDPRLIGCYRTFDEFDSDPLTFCNVNAAEKYDCAIVFDVYQKKINAYDASKSRGTLPIYLSYDNLVDTVKVDEITDEMVTQLHVYGSDGLSIRDVNPTGMDCIVDLSYFIESGDLDVKVGDGTKTLAERVNEWRAAIDAKRQLFSCLTAARASKSAQKIVEETQLSELENELETVKIQQSAEVQAYALEKTDAGKARRSENLNAYYNLASDKQSEIAAQRSAIDALQADIESYGAQIRAIADELAYDRFFTAEERRVLGNYLIDQSTTEETFVASDVDDSVKGVTDTLSGDVTISGADITRLVYDGKRYYSISGGAVSVASSNIRADIVRGTLEVNSAGNGYILSMYLGKATYNSRSFPSGMLTANGTLTAISGDFSTVDVGGVPEDKGTRLALSVVNSSLFFTVNVNDYQKYSVEQELYDFGQEILDEKAWPVYEFILNTANFLYQEKFAPFRDALELGKAVYLNVGSNGRIAANIIGVVINFDDPSSFDLVFSNRFQLRDGVARASSGGVASGSSGRSFNASKFIYNRAADKTCDVSKFMQSAIDAAVNTVLGARNQSVVIDGSGIRVGGMEGEENYQLRIVDKMIAMTRDGWKSAGVAIGLIASPEQGVPDIWGVNAELLAGKAMITNKFTMEDVNDDGVMCFKLDQTGAWLYNSTMVLQGDDGGLMIFDPKIGITAGSKLLYNTNGTTVTPEFINSAGELQKDSDGMPKNANFFLDINDGSAYFRGKIVAQYGKIGGFTIGDESKRDTGFLHTGSSSGYVALNGSVTNDQQQYAMWCGAESPASASFWVKKNGDIYAKNGTFKGYLEAAKIKGTLNGTDDDGWLEGCGIKVGKNTRKPSGYNFYVDRSGNVWLNGNIYMNNGTISWGDNISDVAKSGSYDDLSDKPTIPELPSYIQKTKITSTSIESPTISGGTISGATISGGEFTNSTKGAYLIVGSGQYGDLYLYSRSRNDDGSVKNTWETFHVYDGVGYATIALYGRNILTYNDSARRASFNVPVDGITATFG